MSHSSCYTCGGSGRVDSGGIEPWGAPIFLPCPECQLAPVPPAPAKTEFELIAEQISSGENVRHAIASALAAQADAHQKAMADLIRVAHMATTPERDAYSLYHDWHQRLRTAAYDALAAVNPHPLEGGAK